MSIARSLIGVTAFFAFSGVASAAELSGVLLGEKDLGQYALPAARLDLCAAVTGQCTSAFTDSAGEFRFENLEPGQYNIQTPAADGSSSLGSVEVPQSGEDWLKVIAK